MLGWKKLGGNLALGGLAGYPSTKSSLMQLHGVCNQQDHATYVTG